MALKVVFSRAAQTDHFSDEKDHVMTFVTNTLLKLKYIVEIKIIE